MGGNHSMLFAMMCLALGAKLVDGLLYCIGALIDVDLVTHER